MMKTVNFVQRHQALSVRRNAFIVYCYIKLILYRLILDWGRNEPPPV